MKIIVKKLDIIKDSWWINRLSNKAGEIFFICISMKKYEKIIPLTIGEIKERFINIDGIDYVIVAPISKRAEVKDGQKLKKENLFFSEAMALSESPAKFIPIETYLFNKPAWISDTVYIKQKRVIIN